MSPATTRPRRANPMPSAMRMPELTPLRCLPKTLEAAVFNRIRVAQLRFGKSLRIALTRRAGLEVMFFEDGWLCVDADAEDQPILAWRDFEIHERDNLHLPVKCVLCIYHHCGGLIMGDALDDLREQVDRKLAVS